MLCKSIKNILNKFDEKIAKDRKNYLKWLFRPTFRQKENLDNELIITRKYRCGIKLSKSGHTGTSILELSLVLVYDFRYQYNYFLLILIA